MGKNIFRKVALERLSSPEQLDQLMKIISPKAWLSLLAFSLLVGTAVIWGIFGTIPHKVVGSGILVKSGGINGVASPCTGKISDISYSAGDIVETGDIIARIEQTSIINSIREKNNKLKELDFRKKKILAFGSSESNYKKDYFVNEKKNTELLIADSQKEVDLLGKMIKSEEKLLKQGLITPQKLMNTKKLYSSTKNQILKLKNQLNEISLQKIDFAQQSEFELNDINDKINMERTNIRNLKFILQENSVIVSPYSGRIVEMNYKIGDAIGEGRPIAMVEKDGKDVLDLQAIIYFPAGQGKKIKVGMAAEVSPETVKKEEFGFMLGNVVDVEKYPATYNGMMNKLKNESLVKTISKKGVLIGATIDLIPDENTVSGFKWSSPEGPPVRVLSGTLANSDIIISEQHPIDLIIPILKKSLGI